MMDEPARCLLSCAERAALPLFQREKHSHEMDVHSQGTCRGATCVTGNGVTFHDMKSSQEVLGPTPKSSQTRPFREDPEWQGLA